MTYTASPSERGSLHGENLAFPVFLDKNILLAQLFIKFLFFGCSDDVGWIEFDPILIF